MYDKPLLAILNILLIECLEFRRSRIRIKYLLKINLNVRSILDNRSRIKDRIRDKIFLSYLPKPRSK